MGEAAGCGRGPCLVVPGLAGTVTRAHSSSSHKGSSYCDEPVDVGNLISGSSAFSKTSLNIRKFMDHILLKPGLENFEHDFTSM